MFEDISFYPEIRVWKVDRLYKSDFKLRFLRSKSVSPRRALVSSAPKGVGETFKREALSLGATKPKPKSSSGEKKNMPTNKTPSLTIYSLFLGLLWFDYFPGLEAATGKLGSVPGVYVFGDSLVDAGNNNYLAFSVSKANYPHNGVDFPGKRPTGRFSNGKNAADAIAEKFGLPLPPPYLSLRGLFKEKRRKSAAVTGVNFASGGAGIFNSSDQKLRIHDTGARRFLAVGVAQIGCTPGKREKNSAIHECDEEANTWCSLYNEALVKMLQQLKQELQSSITYSYFDNFKSLHDIISNPARYVKTNCFADVTSACCGNGKLNADTPCLPITRYCSDRTKYLFWDRYGHPTEAAARTFIDLMLSDDSQYSSPLTLTQLVSS
ncbi:hypothetical protein Bca101_032219 [Brassica carinata]